MLPKSAREMGVRLGDRGALLYAAPSIGCFSEQEIPVFVLGFYDSGIIPLGAKMVIADQSISSLLLSTGNKSEEHFPSNGLFVRMKDPEKADGIKKKIVSFLKKKNLDRFWKVETFREYEYAKDMLLQIRSEKHLFMIIAAIIMIVACSNIISMLMILVKDKKREIAILQSMGASKLSCAALFGFCGAFMGIVSSCIGTLLAWITLQNIHHLVAFLSHLQGYEAFNPLFFGDSLPNSFSVGALYFAFSMTLLLSILAGIVPAWKASSMETVDILRGD